MDPRDSISSSKSYYSNPYRSDLDYSKGYYKSVIEKERTQDRIESSQQKIEEKLLTQFRQNQFRLPLGKFVIIGQIGKYIILAVMLPPYIFLYGMPKWLFEQTMPWAVAGFTLTSKWVKELIASTERLFALSARKIRLAFSKKEKKASHLKAVWDKLNKARENAQDLLSGNLKRMAELLSQILAKKTTPLVKLGHRTAKICSNSMDKLAQFKEWILLHANKVLEKLSKRFERLRQKAQDQFEKMQTVLKKAYERIKAPVITTINYIDRGLNAVLNSCFTVFSFSKRPLVFIGKRGINGFAIAKAALKPFWQLAKAFAKRVYSEGAGRLERGAKKAADLINKSLNQLKRPVLGLSGYAKSLAKKVSKKCQKVLDQPMKRVKEGFEKGFSFLRQRCVGFVLRLKEKAYAFKNFLRNLPAKFLRFLIKLIKKFFYLCRLIFSKSIYCLRLGWAWTRILSRHSWNSLKETLS